jgi:hypothetical protein
MLPMAATNLIAVSRFQITFSLQLDEGAGCGSMFFACSA